MCAGSAFAEIRPADLGFGRCDGPCWPALVALATVRRYHHGCGASRDGNRKPLCLACRPGNPPQRRVCGRCGDCGPVGSYGGGASGFRHRRRAPPTGFRCSRTRARL